MKIKTLLAQAQACRTDEDAGRLCAVLQDAVHNNKLLRALISGNRDYGMEGDNPFVQFEMSHVISDHYVTTIRPEIRDNALTVVVSTNRMLDGRGMCSQNWELHNDMIAVIETTPDQTVAQVAKLAGEKAAEFHAQLISEVGVPLNFAREVAKVCWKES